MATKFRSMFLVLFTVVSMLGLLAPTASAAVGTMDGGGRDPKILVGGIQGPVQLGVNHCSHALNSIYSVNGRIYAQGLVACNGHSGNFTVIMNSSYSNGSAHSWFTDYRYTTASISCRPGTNLWVYVYTKVSTEGQTVTWNQGAYNMRCR